MCKQLVVIQEGTAEKFQESLNSKLRELEHLNPQIEFNHGQGFCAYLIYSDNSRFVGIVEAKNHCICDTCMRCQEPPAPHVKWRKCDIYGSVKRTTDCSEYLPGGGEYHGN